jgi:hypothetical protein
MKSGTSLQVVENPREVVQRLGRLETDDAQLVGLLTQLPPGQVERLGRLARDASKQARRQRTESEQRQPSLIRRIFARAETFGD